MKKSNLGELIKTERKKHKLSQEVLSGGICTQGTISNLENLGRLPTLEILLVIVERLNIPLEQFYETMKSDNSMYYDEFNEVQLLCNKIKHGEAKKIIVESIDFDQLTTDLQRMKYYYYFGITSLIGENNYREAHYNFNQVIAIHPENINLFHILAINGIAITYYMEKDSNKAKTYFENALKLLEPISKLDSFDIRNPEIIKVYFNTATYYSEMLEYKKAVEMSEKGLEHCKNNHIDFGQEYLIYEKAYNLYKLNQKETAEKNFIMAGSLALLNDNQNMVLAIKKDAKEFGLEVITQFLAMN
ncbi:helix-turn-helix domain-containing protein [Carnobacterium gallinarum]|uniref:helix-turn-helix transcriptional regulator n=1 Tax=Carnobacterium gallinarum TaxID=2749 RepID=UPI00054FB18E|nr:helix-turn-helix transcriptional regulator [Carnobacterium gallinarum]